MAKKIIIILIIVLAIAGGVLLVLGKLNNSSPTNNSSSANPAASQENTPAAATVTYTDSGFQPALSTIKVGQTIKFVNNASRELQVDSDPHPIHTDEPELNIGIIAKGDSRTVTLTKQGTWGFHNHLNPTDQAKVDVH